MEPLSRLFTYMNAPVQSCLNFIRISLNYAITPLNIHGNLLLIIYQ